MKSSKALINRMRQDLMSKTSGAEKAAIRNCELLGYKVVRQQPITTGRKLYFADIYLPDLKTIIEIDGGYHYTKSQRRKDNNRSSVIWRMGYHVVRLNNHDAHNINKIKAKIELMKNKKIRNKDNVRPLHPDPRHWTRKQHSNSWKAKVAYESEEAAAEFLQQNPKLKA